RSGPTRGRAARALRGRGWARSTGGRSLRRRSRGPSADASGSCAILRSRMEPPPTPANSPLTLDDVLASADYLDLRTPKVEVGDRAPDFELPLLDRAGTVRLSALVAASPVALVFGSYT